MSKKYGYEERLKDQKPVVLTPDHRFWKTFERQLDFYCNFSGNHCKKDYTGTRKVLRSMPNIDIEETLELLNEFGGYCDCKILRIVECNWKSED